MQTLEHIVDVRPILEAGDCPFDTVMDLAENLENESAFTLIAPFDPVPLYEALEAQGFNLREWRREEGAFVLDFERLALQKRPLESDLVLTNLEPPEPMIKAFEAFEQLTLGATLRLHTRFKPVHLLNQLQERDCLTESFPQEDGTWQTWILKTGRKKCEH